MPRRTVWVSDELDELARSLPKINWSEALARGVRGLAACEHEHLECTACGTPATSAELTGPRLEAFYRAVMFELGAKVGQPGYEGAARILRRIAVDHQVPGIATVAIPRATRAQHEARLDAVVTELPAEADARRRHPTARPVPTNHPGPQAAHPQEHTA